MKHTSVRKSCLNCVPGSVKFSNTTAQHVCTGHNLHMIPSIEEPKLLLLLQLLLLCEEMLHESGRWGGGFHIINAKVYVPLNVMNWTQNYSPLTPFQLVQG